MFQFVDGLADVAGDYDLFVVDQWGCMHDGARAHAGAVEALRELRQTGARVVLVSNSSRGIAPSQAILRGLGFSEDLYDAMVTAGGLARVWLDAALAEGRVRHAWSLLSPPGPTSVLTEMSFPMAARLEDADVVVVSGVTDAVEDAFDGALRIARRRGIPLLCMNPDKVSIQPDGRWVRCPGFFAERYASMGGEVISWGKPDAGIYAAAVSGLGQWRRGLAIGDSLEHDIVGGESFGLDTMLVTRGIHWRAVADFPTQRPDMRRLTALFGQAGVTPTYVASQLAWRRLSDS